MILNFVLNYSMVVYSSDFFKLENWQVYSKSVYPMVSTYTDLK